MSFSIKIVQKFPMDPDKMTRAMARWWQVLNTKMLCCSWPSYFSDVLISFPPTHTYEVDHMTDIHNVTTFPFSNSASACICRKHFHHIWIPINSNKSMKINNGILHHCIDFVIDCQAAFQLKYMCQHSRLCTSRYKCNQNVFFFS